MTLYMRFSTLVPTVPRSFRIMHRHYDTIYLDWEEPAEPNGILTGYILKYQMCKCTYITLVSHDFYLK